MSLWEELKRRNVVRVGVAYLAFAWLLIQVADTVLPNFGAPGWIIQALISSVALGFPVALLLAWFYELTPAGIISAADAERGEAVRFTGRRIDFVIIGLLVLAVGFLLARSPSDNPDSILPNSVAVLPFESLSPDPNDAFYATGIHIELLNLLHRISDLNAIARDSVLRYEGTDLSNAEIAGELGVEMLVRANVRYADSLVRVNAELIDPRQDVPVWSDVFDGSLSDVFGFQSAIAANIAGALEAQLSPEERQRIETPRTVSDEAYEYFLRAMVLYPGLNSTVATPEEQTAALNLLSQAVEIDPNFALAHAHIGKFTYQPGRSYELNMESIRRALDLDPELGFAYGVLARMHWNYGDYQESVEANETAIRLTPGSAEILSLQAFNLAVIGQIERAQELNDGAVLLDPNNWSVVIRQSSIHMLAGRYAEAGNALQRLTQIEPGNNLAYVNLSMVESILGNPEAAEEYLRAGEEVLSPVDPGSAARIAYDYSRLGLVDDAARVLALYESARASGPTRVSPTDIAFAQLAMGNSGAAIAALEEALPGAAETQLLFVHNVQRDPVLEQPDWLEFRDSLYVRIAM